MTNTSEETILHPDSNEQDILRIVDCSLVLGLPREERCDFVNKAFSCKDHVAIFNYLNLVYCHIATEVGWMEKLVIPLLLFICCICFYVLSITADVRLCPALQMLSKMLRMSEPLAGVTLLAFGNGAQDFFSSLFSANKPDRQLYAETFASAMLLTSLIPGLIIVTSPFRLQAYSVLRDTTYILLGTVLLNFLLMRDSIVTIGESMVIMASYIIYIIIVFLDQYLSKRQAKADQEVEASEVDLSRRTTTIAQPLFLVNYGGGKNSKIFRQLFLSIIPFDKDEWNESNCWQKFILIFKIPIVFVLNLLIPTADVQAENSGWSKLLNSIQLITVPVLVCLVMINSELKHYMTLGTLCVTLPFALFVLIKSRVDRRPKYHWIFAIYSVVGAACVISITAHEICGLAYCFCLINGVSSSFLASTLLPWGNCLGDMVGNLIMAKHGFQTMGFAACFGAPIFNMFFVLGFSLAFSIYTSEIFEVNKGPFGELANIFLTIHCCNTIVWMTVLDFNARRMIGILCIFMYIFFFTFTVLTEVHIIDVLKFDWDRSFSEPDLTDPYKHLQRFVIKHPHEYIAVDDLKFFRRKRPLDAASDYHTRSNICLNVGSNEYEFPLYTEYKCKFQDLDLANRPTLLRRSTSLHLEGLMHHQSEHQSQYHWFTPEDWKLSRTYPIKNPENIHLGEDSDMTAEYRSSYISYPMVDRTMKILPREMFRIDSPPKASSNAKNIHRTSDEIVALKKINEDKMKRQQATKEQQKSILQQRAAITKSTTQPSEYKHQFVQFPIEKAHSIPQISHIEMQGDFKGVPEYQDSFKMYANYSKSAPIKKDDNLRMSGAEVQAQPLHQTEVPEYKEKFNDPPVNYTKEKLLKTDDHLRPKGEFTKEIPEYHESFSDPQVKEMPERGKPREPYLRLKGKLEFNPEYRNTYLDFPRSRPVVRKPASSFRLPNSSTTTAYNSKSPHISPRRKYKSTSPRRIDPELSEDITTTPEYRRANYIYQIRERTPTRKITEMESVGKAGGANPPLAAGRSKTRKGSDSSIDLPLKPTQMHKRRPSRNRNSSFLENSDTLQSKQTLDKMGTNLVSKAPKFGRRATLLHNANKCRDHLAENNSDFALRRCKANAKTRNDYENQDSFVVLNEPCKRSNWMKKSWYDS